LRLSNQSTANDIGFLGFKKTVTRATTQVMMKAGIYKETKPYHHLYKQQL